jgi:Tfp pilus assembly protein PilX
MNIGLCLLLILGLLGLAFARENVRHACGSR